MLQIHYTPNGKETEDQTKIGLVFAKEKPTERVVGMAAQNLYVQDSAGRSELSRGLPSNFFPNGATILAFLPHMHLRGKAFEYRAVYPDGRTEVLLRVPQYDFFWQLDYKLAEPLKIPPGTQHRVHGLVRQFRQQSEESRSHRHGQFRRAELGRDDGRLLRHGDPGRHEPARIVHAQEGAGSGHRRQSITHAAFFRSPVRSRT